PTSGADSVDSKAKVSSFGQVGSAAKAEPTDDRNMASTTINRRILHMGLSWSDDGPTNTGREDINTDDHPDDEQNDRGRLTVVEGADGVPQIKTDAAPAYHADDRGRADIRFKP